MHRTIALSAGVLLLAAAPALAQSNVSTTNKHAWGENVGWLNWRDANNTAQGVRFKGNHLTGYVWGENIGWINVGNGVVSPGTQYANTNNTNFGVNVDPITGLMSGYAWGENVGWINFDTDAALGAFNQEARYDSGSDRFRGYAWGENIGWINLDSGESTKYVGFCQADVTTTGTSPGDPDYGVSDGNVDLADLLYFVNIWNTDLGTPTASPNSIANTTTTGSSMGGAGFGVPDTNVDLADLLYFVNEWNANLGGCP